MKNILTIDFDIIMEPAIQLYNNCAPSHGWEELTNTNSYGNILIGNYQTYQALTNFILNLTRTLKKEQIYFIYDHHDIIRFLDKNEQYIVTNIDHHHDRGYPSKEHPEALNELNCGNWVNFVPNLQHYLWIKNPNSIERSPEENDNAINFFDYHLDNLMPPDQLFICFSIPWVPPCNQPLFYTWMDMLNRIYDTHFDFEQRTDLLT